MNLYTTISNIGLDKIDSNDASERKKLNFYNQALFIGLVSSCLQFFLMYFLMGEASIWFGLLFAEIVLCLYLNKRGFFRISKRLILLTVLIQGYVLVNIIHAKYHFHFSSICIFTFALVILDLRKELLEVVLTGIGATIILFVGEWNIDGQEIMSGNYDNLLKYINISSAFFINAFFMIFILRLNSSYQDKLEKSLDERNQLVEEIARTNEELEEQKNHLEEVVAMRTGRLRVQRDELIAQNEEKEILLKEVHHRVKNNLQIIISLINLQINKMDDASGAQVNELRQIQGRVHSMSLVHKKMYLNPSMSNVNLEDYVKKLVEQINDFQSNRYSKPQVDIPITITIPLDEAICLGLILNEIVTNFHKHVISKNPNGEFSLSVKELTENRYSLIYQDNGTGFDFASQSDSTGMQILDGLVEQLDGSLDYSNDNGSKYTIEFEVKKD